jgi:hypothetical protein
VDTGSWRYDSSSKNQKLKKSNIQKYYIKEDCYLTTSIEYSIINIKTLKVNRK